MDIRKQLERTHSKSSTEAIVRYIGDDKARFKSLMDVFFGGEYRLTQRAAWPLSNVAKNEPQLVRPYAKRLMTMLGRADLHDSVARNILRLYEDAEIPESIASQLFDHCLRFIQSEKYPIAIRAFAITVATRIAARHRELGAELLPLFRQIAENEPGPALRVRIKRAMSKLVS